MITSNYLKTKLFQTSLSESIGVSIGLSVGVVFFALLAIF
jgi:hypothetical protein